MITKKRFMMSLVAICAATMLMVPLAATAKPGHHPPGKPRCSMVSVGAGETWVVSETTRLCKLVIAEDAIVTAPAGYSLTMTVNGVERANTLAEDAGGNITTETRILPGTYQGKIVLTPTVELLINRGSPGPPGNEPMQWPYRAAVYVNDGAVVPDQSVMSAVHGGKVTDTYAKNIRITSAGDYFNGIMVSGDSTYSILNPRIDFTGNGHDDFAGFGAGIRTAGNAQVTVDKARIVTDGVVRTGVWVGDNSVTTVNNSYIETGSGTPPDNWMGGPFPPGMGGSMMSVPWMLGITGNCRATSCLGSGTVYYNNCYVKAKEWGALSTDMCFNVHLYASNTKIEVLESGYGAYADMTSLDTFSHCLFNVPDYGLIQAGGSGVFTDGTVVNSGRWGIMFHAYGTGSAIVNKGSVFNTELAVFLVKSSFPTIDVDGARLNSKNGLILQAMINDDFMAPGMPGADRDIDATFSNMHMRGDIVNTMTNLGNVNVTLNNATIKGAITTGTQTWVGTYPRTIDNLEDMGMVTNTYEATAGPYGVTATLDATARWIVTQTSYLTGLTIADGAVVTAPKCYSVNMLVDGFETPIAAGTYTGAIVLEVTPDHCGHGYHPYQHRPFPKIEVLP